MVRTGLAAAVLNLAAGAGAAAALELSEARLGIEPPAAQPSVAVDRGRGVFVVTWQSRAADGCTTLSARTVAPGSDAPGPIRTVARGCDWFVNWADFPSLVVADNGDWVTFWLQKSGPGTYAYDIRLVRSRDAGQSWSAPLTPHRDGTSTEHGFVSMLPLGRDRVLVAWLDGRRMAAPTGDGHDATPHAHQGPMTLRSAVVDRRGRLSAEAEVDGMVCDCCPTDLASVAGRPALVYRDRSADEIRDVYVARFTGAAWSLPQPVNDDRWRIAGCPVNGPAAAVSAGALAIAWPTFDAERLELKIHRPASGAAPRVLENSSAALGRVDLAPWGKGGFLASWIGGSADGSPALRIAALDAELETVALREVAALPPGRGTGMPRLAALGGTALLLWTEPDSSLGVDARVGSIRARWIDAGVSARSAAR